MKILENEEIPLNEWQELIKSNPYASPFQTHEFYDLFNSMEGLSAQAIAVTNQGKLLALTVITFHKESGIKSYFSRRGIIYGGPLIDPENPKALKFLLQTIPEKITKLVIYIEIRNYFSYTDVKSIFLKKGWEYVPYLNVQLKVKGLNKDSLILVFKYNRRREIKQSLASGASFTNCANVEQLKEIYNILKDNYLKRVKLPLPKFEFFLEFFQCAKMKAFTVLHNGKIIGGAFCPVLDKRGLYTFYYCGLRNYHKRIFPTHLAILAAMEYCIKYDIPHFDFMGAGRPEIEYGVRQYKLEFGGELVEHGRFIRILNPFLYRLGNLVINTQSKFRK